MFLLPWLGGSTVVGRGEATVSVAPRLKGGTLMFSDPRVDTLQLGGPGPSMVLAMNPSLTEASITDLATEALVSIVPVIPVPSLDLPGWLRQHGPSGLAATDGTVWVEDARIGITIPQIVVR